MSGDTPDSNWHKVLDRLFIGGHRIARDKQLLLKLGITHIVNCSLPKAEGGVHNVFEEDTRFKYLRVSVVDSDEADLEPHFKPATRFINKARKAGDAVLVHCQQGVSRSSSIILAYMMVFENLDLKEAYKRLKIIRPVVKPKKNFLCQLIALEKRVKEKRATREAVQSKRGKKRSRGKDGKRPKKARVIGASLPPELRKSDG